MKVRFAAQVRITNHLAIVIDFESDISKSPPCSAQAAGISQRAYSQSKT